MYLFFRNMPDHFNSYQLTVNSYQSQEVSGNNSPPLEYSKVGGLLQNTISVNFRKNNRLSPQAGRFGFLTEPDPTRKP